MKLIGVISDTHGLLREEAVQALRGVDLIIHAGDIGSEEVIRELRKIAPVIAVRGNCDRDQWAKAYPKTEYVEIDDTRIYVLHELNWLNIDPKGAGINIVISGHSHRPKEEKKDGVLYLNPGSAGPRRFNLPVSVARLTLHGTTSSVDFISI
ncbi:MAG: putative phosphoesterase [Firmicutes bacterium]|nr:putative phosphoesterase [Bacillota bacterium]MDI6706730.1 metallophosphoesterase family protein [Bacillota bacterium]